MTDPGPPPARLYVGHVMHMRLIPRRHAFRYRVWTLLADIDRLGEIGSRLLRVNRFGVLSVHEADHGPRTGGPLRPWVEARLAEVGLPVPARIELLALPRLLGYVFNPISVYFCRDAAGRLDSVIYQVRNTFGDQEIYALPAGPVEGGAHRQVQAKTMFVSPFIPMEQTYRFTLRDPGRTLALRIRQGGAEGEVLIAAQTGTARPLTDRGLARLLVTHPLQTVAVMAAIHWQALRLALKGVRFLGHPGIGAVYRRPAP